MKIKIGTIIIGTSIAAVMGLFCRGCVQTTKSESVPVIEKTKNAFKNTYTQYQCKHPPSKTPEIILWLHPWQWCLMQMALTHGT